MQTAASWLSALAVCFGIWVSIRGLWRWRLEMREKRRAEVAERALTMIYQARDILATARSPMSFGNEGATRISDDNEPEREQRYKNSLYAPVERLYRDQEFWPAFEAARYPFMVFFGTDGERPFDEIRKVRNAVIISARMLIDSYRDKMYGHETEDQKKFRVKCEAEIGWTTPEKDPLKPKIDAAISLMESMCKPAIMGAVDVGSFKRFLFGPD